MEFRRYFIKLSYKGTHFFGWQIQPNAITVQETLAEALKKINRGKAVKVTGCGRTDTGVHASEFYAHADFENDPLENGLDIPTLMHKLNCMIPGDIAIHNIFKVTNDVHSRFSATARTYDYFIHQKKHPFLHETSWFHRHELDVDKMNKACQLLLDRTNFKCFSKTITGDSSFECDVSFAEWVVTPEGYQFTIKANRFLRNMVRAIVGTMTDIGMGKTSIEEFISILDSEDRNKAGKSAPAQGLFLSKIDYANNPEVS